MAKYKTTGKNGKVYEYEYSRKRYNSNDTAYNKAYYLAHREELLQKKREKTLAARLEREKQEMQKKDGKKREGSKARGADTKVTVKR